jgi:cardiolipin synthase
VVLITEPQAGNAPFISMIQNASKSVDLVMYQLEDTQIEQALATAASRGVRVRVLLNKGYYGEASATNQPAYTYLKSHAVQVNWTPSYFALTHEKTMVIDERTAAIMTLNFTSQYYKTSRDFSVTDTNAGDVDDIETIFSHDWDDQKLTAPTGSDLVWSPGSQAAIVSLIASAKQSIDIYNEEMADQAVITALETAARRGVSVEVDMTDSTDWQAAFTQLSQSGVQIRTYAANAPLYIHAKMILVDSNRVFLGSENFSSGSLTNNRELGIVLSTSNVISQLQTTFAADWRGATPYGTVAPAPAATSPASTSTITTTVVKLSSSGICHAPGDSSYSETTRYTSYTSLAACQAAGGRLPE